MFATLAITVLAAVSGVLSAPLAARTSSSSSYPSLSSWGGHQSLDHFDDFYGSGHFDVSQFSETVIEKQEVVCHSQQIEIIQQRLVILQEMAKRIISEQICEVETQTIVLEQFHSSVGSFHHGISRDDGHHFGYDNDLINSHYGNFFESDGSLSTHDFGFKGTDIGHNGYTVPSGTNWDDNSSHASILSARSAAKNSRSWRS